MNRNVVVIAPHPDDETIGCGGTVRLRAQCGDRVRVVFLTSGELGLRHMAATEAWRLREAEARAAAEVLGVAAVDFLRQPDWYLAENVDLTAGLLRPILECETPRCILLPHPGESHPDHAATLSVLQAALQGKLPSRPQLLMYEIWTPLCRYDHVQDITSTMSDKLRALRCYESQLDGFRYDRAVRGLNQYRGALAGRCRYAEVFHRVDLNEDGERR